MLANNPQFSLQAESGIYKIYIPTEITEYHTSRYIAANNQNIYSNGGATPQIIQEITNEIIARCNHTNDIKTTKTDIAALANNLLYRTKYPVDEQCSIRMGCILSFLEYEKDGQVYSEDPDKTEHFWLEKKMQLAIDSPELYTFFLTWGISNTPGYKEALDTSISTDYFSKRRETIAAMVCGLSPTS